MHYCTLPKASVELNEHGYKETGLLTFANF